MDPQLRAQLLQTIYVAARTGYASGSPTYGTAASRLARVERETRVIDAADGSRKTTTHSIIVEASIGELDRIWLPGDSSATASLARTPAAVYELVGELGAVDHYEVLV